MPKLITVEQALAEGWYRPNTNGGLCHCGCGQKTPIATFSSRTHGYVKDQPLRYFARGHVMEEITVEQALAEGWYQPNTNDGYCHCGCGKKTAIAPQTARMYGHLKGYPKRYFGAHKGVFRDPNAICAEPTCSEPVGNGWTGFCESCYKRWLKGSRRARTLALPVRRPCPIPGCTNNYEATSGNECCSKCSQARNPGGIKRSLEERIEYHIFKPDGEDGCWLWGGPLHQTTPILKCGGQSVIPVRRHLYCALVEKLHRWDRCYPCSIHSNCVNPQHTLVKKAMLTVERAMRQGWYRPNTNNGYCHCGCGKKTALADRSDRKLGVLHGQPRRYLRGHARRKRASTD